ncbi:MAG: hypothetical protein IPK62_02035 [Bacteroidetes bacterium]|nr:hypothetical protein [Bacteroidota bacterium]
MHTEVGKCNAEELCKIIENIRPEVIFLEALDETYSTYDTYLFSSFGVSHKKLEISAIQRYGFTNTFEYIPVLDNAISAAFETKSKIVCENREWQELIDSYRSLASEYGFKFLNSTESIKLQEEMRILERHLLNGLDLNKCVDADIDAYENSMIRNIHSYCERSRFNSAIFMCGAAHRKSIIEKVEKLKSMETDSPNWIFF